MNRNNRQNKNRMVSITAFIIAAAGILLSLLLQMSPSWQMIKYMILGWLLLAISIVDYRSMIIPDELLLAGLVCYVPVSLLNGEPFWQIAGAIVLQGCSVSVPLLLFVLLADRITGRETMGFGDIKLFFLLGVYLGVAKTWLALFLACIAGLVCSLGMMLKNSGEPFPFAPSIAIGAWITVLWGQSLLEWYCGFLL